MCHWIINPTHPQVVPNLYEFLSSVEDHTVSDSH